MVILSRFLWGFCLPIITLNYISQVNSNVLSESACQRHVSKNLNSGHPMDSVKSDAKKSKPKRSIRKPKPSCALPLNEFTSTGRVTEGSKYREGYSSVPPWINLRLARRGQQFALDNIHVMGKSHLFGLIFIIMFPDGRDVLLMTRKSDTIEGVKNRYSATMAQTLLWYRDPIFSANQSRDSAILTSLANVRNLHVSAAEMAKAKLSRNETLVDESLYSNVVLDDKMWTALAKDLELTKFKKQFPKAYKTLKGQPVPVNQFVMAMTQFAFIGLPVLFPKRLGFDEVSDEDLWSLVHLWAVIGYILGIEDEFNVALQPDLTSTIIYYQQVFSDYYLPVLYNLDFTTKILVEALLKGFGRLILLLSPHSQMYRLMRICNIEAPNLLKILTPVEQLLELTYEAEQTPALHMPVLPVAKDVEGRVAAFQIDEMARDNFGGSYDDRNYTANYVYY